MRVLHVTDCYLPRLGGIELHVRDLAERQQQGGDDVLVLTGTPAGPPCHPAVPSAVPVERVGRNPPLLGGMAGMTGMTGMTGIRRIVDRFDPDVIQAHLSVASPFGWSVLRAVEGVPTVATMHSLVPDVPAALRAAIRVTGFPAGRVSMTAVSEAAARPWRHALRGQPVRVLHNGIDPAAWSVPARPHDAFTVVSVGRFARRKRQLALVAVMAGLRRRCPDLAVRMVLVGDGPELPRVRAAARRAGLADVIEFPGALSREAIRATLAGGDVYAAPAVLESFGIAALEARCAGLPVVGMAASGLVEFVSHGREGLLAEDDADLARHLLRLAREPGLCASIRAHNLATVPQMAWPAVLRRHDVTYELAGRCGLEPWSSARVAVPATAAGDGISTSR